MRISVHRDRCCAAGTCVLTAPAVFDQSEEDGIVMLLDPEPPSELEQDVLQAARLCPTAAISVDK